MCISVVYPLNIKVYMVVLVAIDRNIEGKRILEFSAANDLVICNSLIKKRVNDLVTYQSGGSSSQAGKPGKWTFTPKSCIWKLTDPNRIKEDIPEISGK